MNVDDMLFAAPLAVLMSGCFTIQGVWKTSTPTVLPGVCADVEGGIWVFLCFVMLKR